MSVVNVRKNELNKMGYASFEEWSRDPNNVYIGRDMQWAVSGIVGSKWSNPFSVKKYGRELALEKYKTYINEKRYLREELHQLRGKNLGCWCAPEKCHGDILLELIETE